MDLDRATGVHTGGHVEVGTEAPSEMPSGASDGPEPAAGAAIGGSCEAIQHARPLLDRSSTNQGATATGDVARGG